MKTILLMRHAKSSWKDASLSDHERPLNKRGKNDAPRMGQLLVEQNLTPDIILCSTAKRARLTVKYLLETCDFSGEIEYLEDLYHADYHTYLEVLRSLSNELETAMIIGHNPEMDEFLNIMCDARDHITTAAIAHIELPHDNWTNFGKDTYAKLVNFWKPRELN